MNIQEEIHKAIQDLQKKVNNKNQLSDREMEIMLLTSLIEEEGKP